MHTRAWISSAIASAGPCIALTPLLGRDVIDGLIVALTVAPFIVLGGGLTVLGLWLDRTALIWTCAYTIVPVAVLLAFAYHRFDQDAQGGLVFLFAPPLITPLAGVGMLLGAAMLVGFRARARARNRF